MKWGASISMDNRSFSCSRFTNGIGVETLKCKRHFFEVRRAKLSCKTSNTRHPQTRQTIKSLDTLLGTADDTEDDEEAVTVVAWDKIPVRQSAAARTSFMAPGNAGRFMSSDLFVSGVRAGRATQSGQSLDIPRVSPAFSYLLAAANLMTFCTFYQIGFVMGDEELADVIGPLVNYPDMVAHSEVWRLLSNCFVHVSPIHLAVNVAALLMLAPEAEAMMGYSTFLTIMLLSGITASTADCLTHAVPFTTGASGMVAGIAAALFTAKFSNRQLEESKVRALTSGLDSPSTSDADTSQVSSNDEGPFRIKINDGDATMAVAAVGLTALTLVVLLTSITFPADTAGMHIPSGAGPGVGGLLAGALAGTLLGKGLGPNFQVIREVIIPDGSLSIPANAPESYVVVDSTTSLQRGIVSSIYASSLCLMIWLWVSSSS